jgi:hypothetical protein
MMGPPLTSGVFSSKLPRISPVFFLPMLSRKFPPRSFANLRRFLAGLLTALAWPAASFAQGSAPVITSFPFEVGTVGQPFTYTITASGNPTNFGASSLPAGLLPPSAGSAVISGLPQAAGRFTSTISAVNASGTGSATLYLLFNPPPPPVLASPATVFGVQGQPLSYPLLVSPNHSNVPTSFSVSGLPSGATLVANVTTNTAYTNVLVTNYFINSPSLSASGSFVVPVVASNSGGVTTNDVTFIINPTAAPVITSGTNATAVVGLPFSFDITAINGPARFGVTRLVYGTVTNNYATPRTNGLLTNGLSISNISVGGSVIGRISGTPGQTNRMVLSIVAANFAGQTNTPPQELTITVNNPSPIVVLGQPLGEVNFVNGSSFFATAQVFDRLPNSIIPSSVAFSADGAALPGIVGRFGDFYGLEFYPDSALPFPFALEVNARNNLNATGSASANMRAFEPAAALPIIDMLPLAAGTRPRAGGFVTLRAQALSAVTPIQRVEFYINKVLVGFRNAPVNADGEYQFAWRTPSQAGSFQAQARVVSQNGQGAIPNPPPADPTIVPVYASVITPAPVVVNTLSGTPPSVAITAPPNNGTLLLNDVNRIKVAANAAGSSIRNVQFYVDGELVPTTFTNPATGVVTTQSNPDTTFPFEVLHVPTSPGAYEYYAIATAANGLQTVSPAVQASAAGTYEPSIPDNLAPGSNGGFVLQMYQLLLYADPTYDEWAFYTEALTAGGMNRADVVMSIMGFDTTTQVFDRSTSYARTSFSALLPFARLGLTPTSTAVQNFIAAVESTSVTYVNSSGVTTTVSGALPITGNYSGMPDAPWNATYGYARAMQEVIVNSPQFASRHRTARGLNNTAFLNWMRPTMFSNLQGGDEARILTMMNTIQPQTLRQGAAMAFRSEVAAVALQAGYVTGAEKTFQLRAGTAILTYQLSGRWSYSSTTKPFSKAVVQSILSAGGYL